MCFTQFSTRSYESLQCTFLVYNRFSNSVVILVFRRHPSAALLRFLLADHGVKRLLEAGMRERVNERVDDGGQFARQRWNFGDRRR